MYNQVKEYIRQRIQIPESDLEKAFQFTEVKCFKKGDYILRIGDYCRFIGFINTGLIMGIIVNEGKEIASNFVFDNCFFTYTEGISINVPSHKHFVALEDCEMLVLNKDKLPLIFAMNPKFETLFTQILAEELRNVLLKEQNIRTESAETRYLRFINSCPGAFNRIPLKYIAGYLGIEAPSLSRLRKKLAGK
jgi:CRP/FNR family transcriptional regulator, anaerobic regulatory protein